VAVLSRLVQEFPSCAPFVITDSLEHGAKAFSLREVSPYTMADALEALTLKQYFVGPLMISHSIRAFLIRDERWPVETQTEREHDVLRLVALRLSNQEIAQRLAISESTVKTHLYHASEKLGARTRREAASLAIQVGIASEPHASGVAHQSPSVPSPIDHR
jgi:DNA-binding NarL/FixJ family response regulator